MSAWTERALSKQNQKEWLQVFESPQLSVAACSIPSKSRESPNEDALCVLLSEDAGFFCVADGLGGQRGGAEASSRCVETFHKKLEAPKTSSASLRTQAIELIESSNKEILSWGLGAGTTCAAICYESGVFRSLLVGDSRVFVIGQKGKLKYTNTPHSLVGFAMEAELMSEEKALKHEDSHIVLNHLGTNEMYLELGPAFELDAFDSLLICSDGLSDNFSTDEIVELTRGGSLEEKIHELTQSAQERMNSPNGKEDDLSIILVRRST